LFIRNTQQLEDTSSQAQNESISNFKVTLIELPLSSIHDDEIMYFIDTIRTDVLIMKNYSPLWNKLDKHVEQAFSSVYIQKRIDIFGFGIATHVPQKKILDIDMNMPLYQLQLEIRKQKKLNLIYTSFLPPISKNSLSLIEKQLEMIQTISLPLENCILAGMWYLPPWNSRLRKFKIESNFKDISEQLEDDNFFNKPGILDLYAFTLMNKNYTLPYRVDKIQLKDGINIGISTQFIIDEHLH